MQDILKKVQIHVPFRLLREKLLNWVIDRQIHPEIGFNHLDLERYGLADFRGVAERLVDAGLPVTFHAPFMDLRPGAIDPAIRRATAERLRRVFELIPWFGPRAIVCHPSFDARYYVSAEKQWIDNSVETWQGLLGYVRGTETFIALENVYERGPEQIRLLLDALDSPQVRFCFDTGHAHAFGEAPTREWMKVLGARLGEIHIHDNNGTADEHLPVGEGTFAFPELLAIIREGERKPILTIESHSEENLRRSLENLGTMKLLENL